MEIHRQLMQNIYKRQISVAISYGVFWRKISEPPQRLELWTSTLQKWRSTTELRRRFKISLLILPNPRGFEKIISRYIAQVLSSLFSPRALLFP